MKKIKYPSKLGISVDKERGKKLDIIAEKEMRARPAVLLRALDFYFSQNVSNCER